MLEISYEDDLSFFSLLYCSVTLLFAMVVLTKYFSNEFHFGFRSILSLGVLFFGEPVCQFLLRGWFGIFLFSLGCLLAFLILPSSHLPAEGKAVLITGCDSGFGLSIAQKLDSIGMTVYAGCLNLDGSGVRLLKENASPRLQLVKLDVTNQEDISNAAALIESQVEEGLWGVVNNAGIVYTGELEMISVNIIERSLDVNFLGSVRVIKSFLPQLRKTHGRIVNVSSLVGKIGIGGYGAYSAAKFALEGYSDVLRREMKKWNVHVSLVEPSGFKTAALEESTLEARKEVVWSEMDVQCRKVYSLQHINFMYEKMKTSSSSFPSDFTAVVRAVQSGLLSKHPKIRYEAGVGAGLLMKLYPLLPDRLADRIAMLMGLDAQSPYVNFKS